MPSLPKSYVPHGAAASYRTMTGGDTWILRFRLPAETRFRTKSSPYRSDEAVAKGDADITVAEAAQVSPPAAIGLSRGCLGQCGVLVFPTFNSSAQHPDRFVRHDPQDNKAT